MRTLPAVLLVILFSTHAPIAARADTSGNIRAHGAKGDGATPDTAAIQAALDACRDAGGGQVTFPPGRYLSGTIHLRSKVALWLEAGATLVGTTNLTEYRQPAVPDFMPEAKWGKWHRDLLLGEGRMSDHCSRTREAKRRVKLTRT